MNLFRDIIIIFGIFSTAIISIAGEIIYYPYGPFRDGILGAGEVLKIDIIQVSKLTNVNYISFGGETRTTWPVSGETNSVALHDGTNAHLRVEGTNIYVDAMSTNQLFYFDATRRIAVTNSNFAIQVLTGESWSNVATFIP